MISIKLLKSWLLIIFFVLGNTALAEVDSSTVVKVYTIHNEHNYNAPWHAPYQTRSTGSGFVVQGKNIITNAHVVFQAAYVEVKLAGLAEKYEASVVMIDHVCDLAILHVASEEFWSHVKGHLDVGLTPKNRDKVTAIGFPLSGEELSYTEGIVSRVEMSQYPYSGAALLLGQIDTAIDPGNSGGPVINNDKVVGVVSQSYAGQNIGFMIPSIVLQHFFNDYISGNYRGFPGIGMVMQKMENITLRAKYGMKGNQTGMLLHNISEFSPAHGILQEGDVLLSIAGNKIANDGTVKTENNQRVFASYEIIKLYKGDKLQVVVLREGKELELTISLNILMGGTSLVAPKLYDAAPTYYINAGITFQPLTRNYIQGYRNGPGSEPLHLMHLLYNGQKTKDRKEAIIITSVLTNNVNFGYSYLTTSIVTEVNGKEISSMQDLVEAFEGNKEAMHTIITKDNFKIVIKNISHEDNMNVLAKYRIYKDRSDNLKNNYLNK